MKQGKLKNSDLKEMVLNKLLPQNSETVLGAAIGEDCCAVDTKDICVLSTDPITAADHQAGMLAIHVNANDIISAGAMPFAALVTLLIPITATKSDVAKTLDSMLKTAKELKIDIIGGHTEVTQSVNSIVISVTMLGKPIKKGRVLKTADICVGDEIIMTKYAGIEGTVILAEDKADELTEILTAEDKISIVKMKTMLSVVKEGEQAANTEGVCALHDITEGGVIGALHEMADVSQTKICVDLSKINVLDVTRKICDFYDLDIHYFISSGSMLISTKNSDKVLENLRQIGIDAQIIASVEEGLGVVDSTTNLPIAPKDSDELYKAL